MTALEYLAGFVAAADPRQLPPDRVATAQRHFTDTMVALAAGAAIPEGRALTILAEDASWIDRLGLMSATIRLTEIDDIHIGSCSTPSAIAVPVALGLGARATDVTAADITGAIWAGCETAVRLGTAVDGARILHRGVWPTFAFAPAAAAATAARILRLSPARTAHALSLALMLAAGGVGRFSGDRSGRWFLFSSAVADGVRAALAARQDYGGDLTLLDGDWLSRTHGIELLEIPRPPAPGEDVYGALSMKPFCSAKQGISAIQAFGSLLDGGIAAEDIRRVTAAVPAAVARMVGAPAVAGSRSTTLVSLRHQIALRALDPDALYDIDRSAPEIDDALLRFANNVEVVPDDDLMKDFPAIWGARVTVHTAAGATTASVGAAQGDPGDSMTPAGLETKWLKVLARSDGLGLGEGLIESAAQVPGSPDECQHLLELASKNTLTV